MERTTSVMKFTKQTTEIHDLHTQKYYIYVVYTPYVYKCATYTTKVLFTWGENKQTQAFPQILHAGL